MSVKQCNKSLTTEQLEMITLLEQNTFSLLFNNSKSLSKYDLPA